MMNAQETTRLIAIVDDDDSMRSAVQDLLQAVDLPAQAFASAEEFLSSGKQGTTACLIADIRMPGMSGLEGSGDSEGPALQRSDHLHHGTWRRKNADASAESRHGGVSVKTVRQRSPDRQRTSGFGELILQRKKMCVNSTRRSSVGALQTLNRPSARDRIPRRFEQIIGQSPLVWK